MKELEELKKELAKEVVSEDGNNVRLDHYRDLWNVAQDLVNKLESETYSISNKDTGFIINFNSDQDITVDGHVVKKGEKATVNKRSDLDNCVREIQLQYFLNLWEKMPGKMTKKEIFEKFKNLPVDELQGLLKEDCPSECAAEECNTTKVTSKSNPDIHRALGLIQGLLHIESMDEFDKEGLVKGLKEIERILSKTLGE